LNVANPLQTLLAVRRLRRGLHLSTPLRVRRTSLSAKAETVSRPEILMATYNLDDVELCNGGNRHSNNIC
jgi:hypothetical protein